MLMARHAARLAGAGGQLPGRGLGVPVGRERGQQSLGGGARVAARPGVGGEQLAGRGRSCVPAVPGGNCLNSCMQLATCQ